MWARYGRDIGGDLGRLLDLSRVRVRVRVRVRARARVRVRVRVRVRARVRVRVSVRVRFGVSSTIFHSSWLYHPNSPSLTLALTLTLKATHHLPLLLVVAVVLVHGRVMTEQVPDVLPAQG